MPPKKVKTRHSSGSILGPPCPLPDIGSIYTVRDVLAAIEMEINLNPAKASRWAITQVATTVRAKWDQPSPS